MRGHSVIVCRILELHLLILIIRLEEVPNARVQGEECPLLFVLSQIMSCLSLAPIYICSV